MAAFGAIAIVETISPSEFRTIEVHDTMEAVAILYPGKTIEDICDDLGQVAMPIASSQSSIMRLRILSHGKTEAAQEIMEGIAEEIENKSFKDANEVISFLKKVFQATIVGQLSDIPSVIFKIEY